MWAYLNQVKDDRLEAIYAEIDGSDVDVVGGEGTEPLATLDANKPKIETLEDAARYAYGLSETRKEIEQIEAIAAKEIEVWQKKIDQVNEWKEQSLKPLKDKEQYLSTLLTVFHMKQFNEAPNEKAQAKLKSIKLPYGVTLSSREQQPKLEVTDESALLEYAKSNGLVEVTEKAKWGDIKKQLNINSDGRVFDANGEEVPFIKVVPQERKFEVK